MPNRLANETSPYLLQHKDNPVNWYPWGDEAMRLARAEDKPIFLSIGYSACHWCHVMEHESFEEETIATQLNDDFISIKVDREERPDLDQIYMDAVQAMTGRGGWPMSVFLTPHLEPFYGGTYWPPAPRMGMPGFGQFLEGVQAAWKDRREQALEQAAKLTQFLRRQAGDESGPQMREPTNDDGNGVIDIDNEEALGTGLNASLLPRAEAALRHAFDPTNGSFGGAPKFPHPM
ncbi:MAG: thioredoxin domain-containing protein, partial [Planctomycetota bacterium]|nr:thioredoxin domain-containing protein [Planctomycetota bacterium]